MLFTKQVEFNLHEVTCKPGDTFTVYLDKEPFTCKRDAVQVELRVTLDLDLEIFFDSDEVKIKSFSDWKQIKR